MNIEQKFISKNYSKGVTIIPKYIVVHETGNAAKGANADAHFKYWDTNDSAQASVHFVVDDTKIIQLLPLNAMAWHVGDNKGHSDITNSNTISLEICINSDGDYVKARQNAIELVRHLINVTGIPADRVVTHNDASGKWCPAIMLTKKLWEDFKMEIRKSDEMTVPNDIAWEFGHRGLVTDIEGLKKEMEQNPEGRLYWFARKTLKYLQDRNI